ncbi:sensor histidine kinase [Sphingomonas arenae]|uniref:sensor histidine kinase n=1 Tax=Sphingomonas arenae TaxID=2812555 RepID=UPI001966EFE8|nr:HAMP domain-containing sensor histidine kinase [Sphingomonas arenae]
MADFTAPATGLVDPDGRLVAADTLLARLQEEAGARIGGSLAVPQLAAIARLVQKLGIPVSRHALAGTRNADLHLWVRAEPEDGSVRLTIERWTERPMQPRRWPDGPAEEQAQAPEDWFEMDGQLQVTALAPDLVRRLEQPAGQPLTRLVRLEADGDGNLPLLTALAGRTSFSGQRARLHADPDVVLLLSGEPLGQSDADFAGYRGQMRFEKDADLSLNVSSPAFDELLREPLDSIIHEAEQIAERAEGPLRSDYAAYASDIASAGRHLLEVLRSMGTDEVEDHDRVDLAELAREAIALVQTQASEQRISLEQEGPQQLAACGQSRAVTQILVNLIGNAVRHSPPNGTVRVILSAADMAHVTVSDEGPGVADADRERIFEKFEQAEPRGEGAGLGLAISRRLARSLGGDIRLDSREGEGARFTLALPLS